MATNLFEYACLVKETRDAQNLFFSVRSSFNLDKAKKLERKLDAKTAQILKGDVTVLTKT